MKKIINFIMSLLLVISLSACGKMTDDRVVSEGQSNTQNQPEKTKLEQKTESEVITRDSAIERALKKAGLTKEAVYNLEAELDKEREGVLWEVDFETKEYEYSYDIDAKTGEVIHQEKERND